MSGNAAERLWAPVSRVIDLLVSRDYVQLVQLAGGARYSERNLSDIRNPIAEYGGTLVSPPGDAFRHMNVIEVKGAHPRRWAVDVPLWTAEEGISDLEVRLTLIEREEGLVAELDDILVP